MSEDWATPGADPRIGMVLQDRYRIVRLLGEGGMGAVYEGEHVLIKRRVAIKCLHAQFASNPNIVARFHREALAATSIGNEHIIEVTDMGRFPDGSVYMVLEFLEGQDFAHAIESAGPMPLGRVVHVATQVCEALAAAHAKGIVHRDLKPENVFLITRGGDPDFAKVLDFGISKFKDDEGGGHSMTRTGARMGTPYYMSTEQAEGKKDVDHRADIYALGVMIFRALTGLYPFDDESFPMLILKICTAPPPSLAHYRPDLPPEIQPIVNKMLAKKRDDRFQSCDEVRAALAPYRAISETVARADVAARAATAPPAETNLALLASPTTVTAAPSIQLSQTGSDRTIDPVQVPQAITPQRPTGSPPWIPIAGGALAAIAAVVALRVAGVFGGDAHTTPRAPAVTSHASIAPPPEITPALQMHDPLGNSGTAQPSSGTTATTNTTPAVVDDRTVTIQIHVQPDDAELFLDGARIANPFDGELPFSDGLHRLEARHAGYRLYVQDLTLNMRQRVSIRMHRGQGTEDHRRAPANSATAQRDIDTTHAPTTASASAHAPAASDTATTQTTPTPHVATPEQPPTTGTVVVPPAQTTLRPRGF